MWECVHDFCRTVSADWNPAKFFEVHEAQIAGWDASKEASSNWKKRFMSSVKPEHKSHVEERWHHADIKIKQILDLERIVHGARTESTTIVAKTLESGVVSRDFQRYAKREAPCDEDVQTKHVKVELVAEVVEDEREETSFRGLPEVLRGQDILYEDDTSIGRCNLSRLLRQVVRDILIDEQRAKGTRQYAADDLVKILALKRGVLITKQTPDAYEDYLSESEWKMLYEDAADNDDLWHLLARPMAEMVALALERLEVGLVNNFQMTDLDLVDLGKEAEHTLRAIYPHIEINGPEKENETSYTAKFCAPHFERLIHCRKWAVRYDTTMMDRMRPDITIEAFGHRLLTVELKSPHASSLKHRLELGSGLIRARDLLKVDAAENDWGNVPPQALTAISPDGVTFYLFKIKIEGEISLFIELGRIPVVNGFNTLPNMSRALCGFQALKELVAKQLSVVRGQKKRNIFFAAPKLPVTPEPRKLHEHLKLVYPGATTPTKQK